MPFGMTTWTPQTNERNWLYTYKAKRIQGFRATHSPSVWMGDYGSFSVMPMTGKLKTRTWERASTFSHENETAGPHHYQVLLEDFSIKAEMTPTVRCSMMRFAFAQDDQPWVVFDAHEGGGRVEIEPGTATVFGYNTNSGYRKVPNFRFYFVLEFDRPFAVYGTWHDRGAFLDSTSEEGHHVGAFASFDLEEERTVKIRIGTSFISLEQARRNLKEEITGWSFDDVKNAAGQAWNEELNRIEVESTNEDYLTVFYTGMYRSHLFPRIFHEMKQPGHPHYFSPYDGKVHDGVMYTDTGFWDTYRAQFPLLSIVQPDMYVDFVKALLDAYDQGGWIPKWPSPGYRSVMTGTHGDCVIADAYAKGLDRFDVSKAYEAMKKGALRKTDNQYYGRVGVEYYNKAGYVPADFVEESLSRTLEFAYDDFCVSVMALAAGATDDHRLFVEKARNYRKVFDPDTGFMRGRNLDGSWVDPFDPVEWGGPYVEGNAWHFIWSVQQDIPGLVELFGGKEPFVKKLDRLFDHPPEYKVGSYRRVIHEMREMEAGGMGQYAHGNEPVHHVPYLYNYAGQPWKGQEKARRVMEKLYGAGPDGLLGDEDNGQMSAWFIFSALGFYPICPGRPIYALGSPLVDRAVVHQSGGKPFVVEAENNSKENKYVQAVFFDGKEQSRNWFEHQRITDGATLKFVMGPEPNKEWGNRPEDAPPSCLPF